MYQKRKDVNYASSENWWYAKLFRYQHYQIKTNPNQPAKIVAVMDEDTFERSNLPQTTDIKDLNGPYGHPYSGRPLEGIEHVPTAWEKFVEDGFSGLFEALSDGNEDMVEHMTNLMENDVLLILSLIHLLIMELQTH